jgi:predicted AlkP superfamily phosphohydrolase/phosphomutase
MAKNKDEDSKEITLPNRADIKKKVIGDFFSNDEWDTVEKELADKQIFYIGHMVFKRLIQELSLPEEYQTTAWEKELIEALEFRLKDVTTLSSLKKAIASSVWTITSAMKIRPLPKDLN